MRKIFFIKIFFFFLSATSFAQQDTTFSVEYFSTKTNISIRALEAVSDPKAWFAANHGVWGFTEDAGKTWHIDSLMVDLVYPEFRSIALLNDSTVLLLSIASPAYLFKTTNKGKTWRLVYKNSDKDIFFDSMKFSDEKNGIAVGDPIKGCFQMISTNDGGENWHPVDCSGIPKALDGEGIFACSNTSIDIRGNKVWFATGGKCARLFSSSDFGRHFEAKLAPIDQGTKMSGIFSFDFADDKNCVITGGNYDKTDSSVENLAVTHDGGKTWKEIKNNKPFFGSCVQWRGDYYFITGNDGTFISNGASFKEVKDKSGDGIKFHTLRFSPTGKTLWFAGDKGRIAFINLAP